jgi:hypothetical protein
MADLHNLQFTVADALGFTSRHIAADLNTETITSNHLWSLLVFFELPVAMFDRELRTQNSFTALVKSQSHMATDGQSVSKSWCLALSGAHDQIFITVWELRFLTRGRVCLLYMLLALSRAVFLGSELLGTHDHNLQFQILYFPFRRLLRLAGSLWRWLNSSSSVNGGMVILENCIIV